MTLRYLALLPFLFTTACVNVGSTPEDSWLAPLHQEHELVGRLWRSSDQRFISFDEFLHDLQQHRFILLGEKHDNPDHHRLQRRVLQRLQQNGNLGVVSFEMLTGDQQPQVNTLTSADVASEQRVREHLQWDEDGWDWSFYGPMLMDVLQAGVLVRAGNIGRDEMMAIYQQEPAAGNGNVLAPDQLEQLNRDIDESHCGMLPASQFPAMVRVQQARDARMAESLSDFVEGAAQHRVLIAGTFHVRRDLGVPNYLPANDGSIAALAFMEANPESVNAEDYLEGFSQRVPYDYLWFTPAVTAEDYCASMRQDADAVQ